MKTQEHIRCGDRVVKIGRTSRLVARLRSYPKGSTLLACYLVDDWRAREAELLALAKLRNASDVCRARWDLGREWFQAHDDRAERELLMLLMQQAASVGDGGSRPAWAANQQRNG